MENFYNTLMFRYSAARPMGYLRFAVFFLSFLIARIPLWFVIICAFLINNTIGITYTVYISLAVIVCRIFIDSEIAGGSRSFLFFACIHFLRGVGAFLFYFIIFGIILYIAAPHNDIYGKISMGAVILLLPVLMSSNNKYGYWNGYHVPASLSIIISFLWLYLAFVPDSVFMNVLIVFLIYFLEFYNFFYNKPLSFLPNRQTIKNLN